MISRTFVMLQLQTKLSHLVKSLAFTGRIWFFSLCLWCHLHGLFFSFALNIWQPEITAVHLYKWENTKIVNVLSFVMPGKNDCYIILMENLDPNNLGSLQIQPQKSNFMYKEIFSSALQVSTWWTQISQLWYLHWF